MATHVSASEVRFVGNLSVAVASDARLESAAFIPMGDAKIDQILSDAGESVFGSLTATKAALVKGAECWFVAGLVALEPPQDDFTAGPVQSKSNAEARQKAAERCFAMANELLSQAGISAAPDAWGYLGGDSYIITGKDGGNVDLGVAKDDSNYPVNLFGADHEVN